MPAFNFHQRFADDVECGRKQQTVRTTRRGKVGDTAYLYTGQRTTKCRKLGEAPLIQVTPIEINRIEGNGEPVIVIDGAWLVHQEAEFFARADGFDFAEQMVDWFDNTHGGLPFKGWLHVWQLPEN